MNKTSVTTSFFVSLALILGLSLPAKAHIELNGFYASESLTEAATSSASRMFLEFTVGFEIDKKGDYLVGWNYSMFSTTDTATATAKYASTQMGPRFLMMLDKAKNWSFGLGYYVVTSATYESGPGSSEKWKGRALKVDVGYSFPISDKWYMGLRGNYSSASYDERLVGATGYSVVAYSKTLLYPSVYTVLFF
jgi:hypothetical protein